MKAKMIFIGMKKESSFEKQKQKQQQKKCPLVDLKYFTSKLNQAKEGDKVTYHFFQEHCDSHEKE